jgi:hypothetical protein
VKLYFDPQSGLLARMVGYSDSSLGLNPTPIDLPIDPAKFALPTAEKRSSP